MKYKIDKQLFPINIVSCPIRNERVAGFFGAMLRPPRSLFRDRDVLVRRETVTGYLGGDVEILIIEPKNREMPSPALVYCHGGGFVFGASGHHYKTAKKYALLTGAVVIFVNYRLAPKYKFPTAPEDCYAALRYVYGNADSLGIDRERIAVGGDSAGGALAAAIVQMSRDRGCEIPLFQLLIYPVTDRRMITQSMQDFTDTPMWDARLSVMMWRAYLPNDVENIAYASPAEAERFDMLSPAYVETAEFDCLRDEGLEYARALAGAGVETEIYETKGTIHAFDLMGGADVTRAAMDTRIAYMNKMYEKKRD